MLAATLSLSAGVYSQNTRFSFSIKGGTIEDVFNQIEEQSDFNIFYKVGQIDVNQKVNLKGKNLLVNQVLDEILPADKASYLIYDKMIVITPTEPALMEQGIKVTGSIKDEKGKPLPGVNVFVQGTTTGGVTDLDGKFSVIVPDESAILVVSYIGYMTEKITVGDQTNIDLTLILDLQSLDEVIVIGYGTVKKSDLTGSVATVGAEDFGDRSGTSIGSLIQGVAPGVDVTEGKVRVRGVTTINNTDPLYVIDGFIGGDASTVHPSDIESIEILKDASATAIYGARGANGVILITTKRGKAGAPTVEFNSFWGVSTPSKKLDILNAQQYMELLKDIEINGGTTIVDLAAFTKLFNEDGSFTNYAVTDRTNWQDEVLHNGNSKEYSLSVRGGTERTSYSVSGAYNQSEAIHGTINKESLRFGFNSDWYTLRERLVIKTNLRIKNYKNSGKEGDIIAGLRMPPYSPVYDENTKYGYSYVTTTDDLNDAGNPVTEMELLSDTEKGVGLMGNIIAELVIVDGLQFHTSFGVVGSTSNRIRYNKPRQNGNLVYPDAELTENFSFGYNPKIENYLTFDREFGNHKLSLLAGNTIERGRFRRTAELYAKGFTNDEVQTLVKGAEKTIKNSNQEAGAYLSYFGRINYVLNNKYLITANMRADASDKFAPENRWGYFPSVAVGWKLHEENFLQNVNIISQLKLRASYGLTGNDAIPPYAYYSLVHSNVTYAFPSHGFGGINFNGATINSLASPIIKWEETKNISVGIDLALYSNMFEINLDYFQKETYDVLFAVPQPPSLGMGGPNGGGNAIVNAADVMNKGVEILLTHRNVIGDLKYSIMANATFVENEVTGLGNGEPYNDGDFGTGGTYKTNRTEEGFPIGYMYGYQVDKVYKTQGEVDADNETARNAALEADPTLTSDDLAAIYFQEASTSAGDLRFIDNDGNGKIDDNDRTDIGNAIPSLTYGLTASAQYKGFDLFTQWTGVYGNSVVYQFGYWMEGMVRPFNSTTETLNRWRSEDQPGDGMTPRAVKTDPSGNTRFSDRYVYSGAYARMKQLSIGYTLPTRLTNSFAGGVINKLRIYISGDNLITISDYPGYDPEIGGDNTNRGRDDGTWPVAKSYRVGLSLNF